MYCIGNKTISHWYLLIDGSKSILKQDQAFTQRKSLAVDRHYLTLLGVHILNITDWQANRQRSWQLVH